LGHLLNTTSCEAGGAFLLKQPHCNALKECGVDILASQTFGDVFYIDFILNYHRNKVKSLLMTISLERSPEFKDDHILSATGIST